MQDTIRTAEEPEPEPEAPQTKHFATKITDLRSFCRDQLYWKPIKTTPQSIIYMNRGR